MAVSHSGILLRLDHAPDDRIDSSLVLASNLHRLKPLNVCLSASSRLIGAAFDDISGSCCFYALLLLLPLTQEKDIT